MPTTINFAAFKELVEDDIDWLLHQPRTLERDHIEQILGRIANDRTAFYNVVTAREKGE